MITHTHYRQNHASGHKSATRRVKKEPALISGLLPAKVTSELFLYLQSIFLSLLEVKMK